MTTRILSLAVLSLLAGCTSPNMYKGLALPTCSGPGSAAEFGSGVCRSGAAYDTARKKVRHTERASSIEEDPELKEIVPLDPQYNETSR